MSLLNNTIYNMDCIEGLKQVDDSSIDLIVTSPPYNAGIHYDSWNDCLPWGGIWTGVRNGLQSVFEF